MSTRIRLAFPAGLFGTVAAMVLLAPGPGVQAQTAPVTITRQSLTLDGANMLITAAIAHANQIGVQEVLVVDDRDGFMIAMGVWTMLA